VIEFCVDVFAEYATVGYMAKRIQMRKNRYLNMQKNNEAKKAEAFTAGDFRTGISSPLN
jgi:hypothetical protein